MTNEIPRNKAGQRLCKECAWKSESYYELKEPVNEYCGDCGRQIEEFKPLSTHYLQEMIDAGFDLSTQKAFSKAVRIRIGCSQCDVLVINGIPCHEHGCPNQRYECKGCNATVSRRGSYCSDCS